MACLEGFLSLVVLFGFVTAGLNRRPAPVFLEKWEASNIISRQKRGNLGDEETKLPPNLERECLEEVCDYEEAREVFQDNYRTDIFWSVYIDGDQCAEQPCKNGAMCSDSVGGYDCICKSGFTGTHCETDQTVCFIDKSKGCSQFCKPGYQSYECSCAHGWKLQQREKCVPAVVFPCGKVSSLSQWDRRQTTNIQSDYEGLTCGSEDCPWQALLRHGSNGFCSAVILKENMVLTTAQCVRKQSDFQVAVGKKMTSFEAGEQILNVKQVHIHPLYTDGNPENDLAVLELQDRIVLKKSVVPVCLPERDFADSVLMAGDYMGVVTGWKEVAGATEFQGNLMLNHLSYEKLPVCSQRHSGQVTNKMACTMPRAKADCVFGAGSPLLTLYRDVFFLTGIVSQPSGMDCKNGYVLQKVSRFLPWLNSFMHP
ncbi:protein Z, vitamin K-dependent plasma glycoprotein a [Myxocyprinus asiaticus]|uniref:protein Z, vitamin K-dependent plasma glycoprotein a n=1 Tax=Myxocyprinus asiaticus TaxID=70543 RepID=UPI0022222AE2|nr:protein Z, vitamin K-dependent plasma glycoprotein a [Myxocyprinus asiaticus]